MKTTVWVLGDQLNRQIASLADRTPEDTRILLVESETKKSSKRWHAQRLHLVLSAMAHFGAELEAEGFEVDHRQSQTLGQGLRDHRNQFDPERVVAMEPMSWDGQALLQHHEVEIVPNNQFLCSYDEFAAWAVDRHTFKMEDFYRWQRRRLDVLMDGDEPIGGRWNFDDENRERPPRDGRAWPTVTRFDLDEIDRRIIDRLPSPARW